MKKTILMIAAALFVLIAVNAQTRKVTPRIRKSGNPAQTIKGKTVPIRKSTTTKVQQKKKLNISSTSYIDIPEHMKEYWRGQSDEYWINKEIGSEFSKWLEKGEFEKTVDYDKRLQEGSTVVFDSICYNVIKNNIEGRDWRMKLDIYNADKEEYPVTFSFGHITTKIRYKVPIDIAKEFKTNFEQGLRYGSLIVLPMLRCDKFVYVTNPESEGYASDLCPSTILFSQRPYMRWKISGTEGGTSGYIREDFFDYADSVKITFSSRVKPVAVRFNDLGLKDKYLTNYVYVFKKGDNDIYSKKEQNEKESKSKEEQNESESNKIFNGDDVDQQPSFPGGTNAFNTFIVSNLKYPVVAQENGIQGRVVVKFIVEKDGSISNVEVDRSVDPSLDNEAMRVIKNMPKWIPGQINGKAVKVECSYPFVFRL